MLVSIFINSEGELNMKLIKICFVLAVACFLMTDAVHAHHLWAVKTEDGYVVARGIIPERMDAYNPKCVKALWAYSPDGGMIPQEKIQRIDEPEQARFRIAQPVSVIGVKCDWGYRVNTTKGKKFMMRRQAEEQGYRVISSFFSTQFSKVFFQEGNRFRTPMGMKFEIVPLDNPETIELEKEFPIQLLFEGKPMAGVSVFAGGAGEWKTDKNGVTHITPMGTGLNVFMARHKVPVQGDPDKDYHLYTTFLVFEVK